MADFTALKTAIQNAIKQNGNEEITGNLLQDVLLAIVTTLGDSSINDLITALGSEATTRGNADATLQQNINAEAQARQLADFTLQGGINTVSAAITAINNAIGNGCVYAGIATPSSTPASGKVFYLALTAGTYTNYGGLEVSQGINILKNNGSTWSLDSFLGIDDAPTPTSNKLVKSGGVFNDIMTNGSAFDLTAYNNGTTYADLNAALTALNALPAAFKKGGMSIKFVQSSDNKYVQWRLMSDTFNTTPSNWQGVDDVPTYGSSNLVGSSGTFDAISNSFNIQEKWIEESLIDSIEKSSSGEYIQEEWSGILFGSWRSSGNRNINGRNGYSPTGANKLTTYLYKFTARDTTLCVKNIVGGDSNYRAYAIFDANDTLAFERKNCPKDSRTLLLRCPIGYTVLITTSNPEGVLNNCFTEPDIEKLALKDILFSYPEQILIPFETRIGYYIGSNGNISGGGTFAGMELKLYSIQQGKSYRLLGQETGAITVAKSFTDSTLETGVQSFLPHSVNSAFDVNSVITIEQPASVLAVTHVTTLSIDAYVLGDERTMNNIEKLQNESEKVVVIDKTQLVHHNGYIATSGVITQQSEDTNFYTDPIPVSKGDVFEMYSQENTSIAPMALFADNLMANLIDLVSKPVGVNTTTRFICKQNGYLAFSGRKNFLNEGVYYIKKYDSKWIDASNNLIDFGIGDFELGKIAASILFRKSLSPNLLITKTAGYIRHNGNIDTWSSNTGVFIYNISSYVGKLINIMKISNVLNSNVCFAFYSSTEIFNFTTYIGSNEYGIYRDSQGSLLIRVPTDAKAFAYYGMDTSVDYTEEQLREFFTLIPERNSSENFELYDIFGIEPYKEKVDELFGSKKIICWGDSLTVGSAGNIPENERWVSRIAANLPSDKYSVLNAGVGGEGYQTIMARNGSLPMHLVNDCVLPSDASYVQIGDKLTNFYNEDVKPLKQGDIALNPIFVKGKSCTLKRETVNNNDVYSLKLNSPLSNSLTITPNVPFGTKGSMKYREPYIAIYWMGTNNAGTITLEKYKDIYDEIIEYTGTEKFIIIGLYYDPIVTRGMYQDFESTFEKKYGLRYINLRKYLVERGWIDAGYTLSASDQQRVANNLVPLAMLVDAVHMNATTQGLLYNLVIERMVELGYIKPEEAVYV